MPHTFEPIGYIQTPFKERFGTPRQPSLVPSARAQLTLSNSFNLNGAFEGLEGFSHVWLIFVFHQNENKAVRAKIHPPRLLGEKIGLFATRTPHRPNPVGLSAVKLERIEGNTLHLSGVDLVDGTPILDIKPYLPSSDLIADAKSGWTDQRPERTVQVEVSPEAFAQFAQIFAGEADHYLQLAREILELDPRPTFYKGSAERPNPYTDLYGFRLSDFNIVYRMQGEVAMILELQPWEEYRAATRGDRHNAKDDSDE